MIRNAQNNGMCVQCSEQWYKFAMLSIVVCVCLCLRLQAAIAAAHKIGFPVIVRTAFSLGGLGSGFAHDEAQLRALCSRAFSSTPQVYWHFLMGHSTVIS